MHDWYGLLRYLVFAAVAWLSLTALASWLVRTRRASPFSPLGRTLRSVSDPLILPMERQLRRRGGNPQHAPWWLAGTGVLAGLLVLTLARWLYSLSLSASMALRGGPRGTLRLAVEIAYQILIVALIVRVVGSWFGVSEYRRWMRPFYAATEWLLRPLRRFVPPLGVIDVTPLVAWLVLLVGRSLLLGIL